MAVNTIALAEKMSDELDKAVMQKTVTGFLVDNVMKSKFVGAKTVLVPNVEFTGMGNYDRDDGFVQGSITVDNVAYELKMDRGRTLQLDAQDGDETGVGDLAGKVMGEYVRTQVVPEVDAYTLSTLASYAADKGQTVTGTPASQAYKMFTDAADKIYDSLGYEQKLVCFVNGEFWKAIHNSPEMSRMIVTSDFKQGDVKLQVESINGIALRPVPASRMKTKFTFNDGTTAGQTAGGFVPATGAKSIGLLMMAKGAGMLVKKAEKTRVFSPDVNQKADAWKFDVRVYYDAFVKNSMGKGIVAYTY